MKGFRIIDKRDGLMTKSHPQHSSPSLQRRDYPRLWPAPPPAETFLICFQVANFRTLFFLYEIKQIITRN